MGLFFFNVRESRTEWIAGGVGNTLTGVQRRGSQQKEMFSEEFLEEVGLEQEVPVGPWRVWLSGYSVGPPTARSLSLLPPFSLKKISSGKD